MSAIASQVAQTLKAAARPRGHLTDRERSQIVRLHKDGLSQRDIAVIVGRPRTTVVNVLNGVRA